MNSLRRILFALSWLVILPASAYAQATLTGVVRDASGAVVPGVTVEVASPVLIEKTRSAVTDGSGQYRLADLLPGSYGVTFSLTGFSTVKREAVQIGGGGVTTLNADMRVGSVAETVTVTGETPVVDVQSSTRQQEVLDNATIAALPASRGYGNLLAAVPGIQQTGLDSGANPVMSFFTAHGGRGNEGTIQIDGMNVGSAFNGGGVAGFGYDTANAAEVQVTVVGGLGEVDRGGPSFNMIPKTGGNKFSGTGFLSTAGSWSQATNVDSELQAFGIADVASLVKNWDMNFALGGPIKKDKLWFYGNLRSFGSYTVVPGFYGNLNAGNPNSWTYVAEDGQNGRPLLQERNDNDKKISEIRLTAQLTPRNKVGFYMDYQKNCTGSSYSPDGKQCRQPGSDWTALNGGFNSGAPETGNVWDDREKVTQASWSSPLTSKLLLEAGVSQFSSRWGGQAPAGALMSFIPVVELVPGAPGSGGVPVGFFAYRAPWSFFGNTYGNDQQHNVWRASANYVTGANSMKFGYQAAYQVEFQHHEAVDSGIQNYLFFAGTPISLTERISPHQWSNRTRFDAFYAQDQWTRGRLTLQGAVRYEHAWSWFPAGENGVLGTSRYNSAPIVFPETQGVKGFNDITPRMGAAYDVFGTGKTSIKVSLSKYLQPANNESVFTSGNPAVSFVQTTDRSWTDSNNDKVANCDLNNPAANGECGPWSNLNFGKASSGTTVNPATLEGWGSRPYDWQFAVSVQQQVMPRVSVEVGYDRRSWGNFYVTDNRAVSPADFDSATIAAPQNAKLPGGGGYPVSFFVVKDAKYGQFDNYFTFAKDYGDVTYYWHGVDFNVNARMTNGLLLQAGTTTGRGVRDTCAVQAKLPELTLAAPPGGGISQASACAVTEVWQTNLRGLAAYTIPKIQVQFSGIIRSQANAQPATTQDAVASNGVSLAGNYDVTSQQIQNAIGRPLPGGAATQTVNLVLPGQLYGPRINSIDLRVSKILNFWHTRTNVGIDLYNLTNANTGTAFNQTYGVDGSAYLRPTTILNPRFVRFNVTVDF